MSKSSDVVIIGAGINEASTACQLAKRGTSVTLKRSTPSAFSLSSLS